MSPAGLIRFLLALRIAASSFCLLVAAIAWTRQSLALALLALCVLAFVAGTWAGRALVVRGRTELAAALVGGNLIAVAAVLTPLAPWATPILVLLPIQAVATVLPFLSGRALRVSFVCAFLSTLWVVAGASALADVGQVPRLLAAALNLSGAGTATLLTLLPLWQFSERLRTTLIEEARAVRVREEFLAIAAHELRTPLTSLQLSLQSLHRASRYEPLPPGVQATLGIVERQVMKLSRLITEMLDVGRMQLGSLDLARDDVDLGDIVRDVVQRYAADEKSTGCEPALHLAPTRGRWDRDKIDHVVANLLANAIKFGAGKPIEVSVESDGPDADARLIIVDHGIGIAPADLPRLFQRFERAVPSRSYGGLGLGLAIARALVEAHGGSIRASSAGTGAGTRVVVELPRGASGLAPPTVAPVTASGSSPAGLLRFFSALALVALGFALLALAIAWQSASPRLAGLAAIALALAPCAWAGRALVARGRVVGGASLVGACLLCATVILSVVAPYPTPTFVLGPLLAVSMVLPFVRGRALALFMVGAFFTTLWVVAGATWIAGDPSVRQFPALFGQLLSVAGSGATAFLALLTLWQFSERLRATLDNEGKALRARDEFLSIASHELRTPLTSLQLSVHRLRRAPGDVAPPSGFGRPLALVERQVAKLAELVSATLDFGRVQLSQMALTVQDVDLSDVVRRVVERFASELRNADCACTLRLTPVRGRWDRDQLDRVVTSLLSNAIKFGAGRSIEIVAGPAGKTGARLTVIDHGIGIEVVDRPGSYDHFERAAASRSYGNLGLGLFIARVIVEAHGGRIRATSTGLEAGTSFIVDVPRAR